MSDFLDTSAESLSKLSSLLSMNTPLGDGISLLQSMTKYHASLMLRLSPATDIAMKLSIPLSTLPPMFPTIVIDGNTINISLYDSYRSLELGRKTAMRPGKALKLISPKLDEDDVTYMVNHIKSIVLSPEIRFAVTADEIEAVYYGGPNSCMAGDKGMHGTHSIASLYAYPLDRTEIVPSSGNTLAVAYIGDITKVRSRAVVDTEGKKFARIYGLEQQMYVALRKLGYTQDKDFILGQRLSKKKVGSYYLCPWIDAKNEDDDSIYSVSLPRRQDWMALDTDGCYEFTTDKKLRER